MAALLRAQSVLPPQVERTPIIFFFFCKYNSKNRQFCNIPAGFFRKSSRKYAPTALKRSAPRGNSERAAALFFSRLFSLSSQERPNCCGEQENRRCPDIQPLGSMQRHPGHGRLRVLVIPGKIGAAHGKQRQKSRYEHDAQRDADPVQHRPSRPLSLCQLEIDDLQLFRNRFQIIRLRRGDRLSQQSADRRLQCLREGKQQVGIWDGKPRFP